MPAVRHEPERGRVLAGQLIEPLAHCRALLRDPHHVGGRVFHARDVVELEQARHGIDGHVDHRTRRNVVDDDRNADGIIDRLEVLIKPLLRGLIVIRRHHQHGIGTAILRVPRELDRLLRRIRPRACDHGNPAPRLLHTPTDDLLVFLVRERRAFSGGADRHEAIGSFGDLPIDQTAKSLLVERAVAEGAKILKPVQDQFYGDRSGFIQDPFGHLWGIATHVEDVSPAEIAERAKKVMQAA